MNVIGTGSMDHPLGESGIRDICLEALAGVLSSGKKILVVIPDHTRHARLDLFFRVLYDRFAKDAKALDYLIATGTHAPMPIGRIYTHVGITAEEHHHSFPVVHFVNHEHDNPAALATIGTIPAQEMNTLTGGVFSQPLDVTINRKVLEYDHIIVISPVVPHEAMGFAGGNKYFFPGIAGIEVVETFHWLAALITNPVVNGIKDTPTRRVIDRAVEFIHTPRTCLAFAVNDDDEPMCLFAGEFKEAWSRAADYSLKLHITYLPHPFKTVLAITPDLYEELWVGGKAMYKLEPVIADGGEVIIYGPQIRRISFMHEQEIRRIGYHVLPYFTEQWDRFRHEPKLILAHSTNVRGIGRFQHGVEYPRVTVTLATSIPEEVCRSVNLGYKDHRDIDLQEWRSRRGDTLLIAENAGQNLFRLRNGSHHPA
jgi:nickel-dependent lactate racemase